MKTLSRAQRELYSEILAAGPAGLICDRADRRTVVALGMRDLITETPTGRYRATTRAERFGRGWST